MAVQVTPYQGSRLADLAITGRQLHNRERAIDQRDTALAQDKSQFDERMKANAAQAIPRAVSEAITVSQQLRGNRVQTFQSMILPIAAKAQEQGIVGPEFVDALRNVSEQDLADPAAVENYIKGMSAQVAGPDGPGIATNVIDPSSGKSHISFAPLAPDTKFTSRLGETGQEQSDRLVDEAGNKKAAQDQAGRLGDAITEGMLAADATAPIRRGLELLDTVETGGVLNQAQLNAARALGVEDPNAGELSNLLGKAVLAQLRSTFGAAFTAEEGKSLKDIEASFGTNPATNRRLLNNALAISERAAKRGLAAAEEAGDEFGAKQIRDALEFTLDGGDEPEVVQYDAQGNRI